MELLHLRTRNADALIKQLDATVDDPSVSSDVIRALIRSHLPIIIGSKYVSSETKEKLVPKIEKLKELTPNEFCKMVELVISQDKLAARYLFGLQRLQYQNATNGDGVMKFLVEDGRDAAVYEVVVTGGYFNYKGTDGNDGYNLWFFERRKGSSWETFLEKQMSRVSDVQEFLVTMEGFENFLEVVRKKNYVKQIEDPATIEVELE